MPELARFLAMGGYAIYVWPAYGAALLVLGGLFAWTLMGYRRRKGELERLQRDGGR